MVNTKAEEVIGALRPISVITHASAEVVVLAHYTGRLVIKNLAAAMKLTIGLFFFSFFLALYVIFLSKTLIEGFKDTIYIYFWALSLPLLEINAGKYYGLDYNTMIAYLAVSFVILYFVYPRSLAKSMVLKLKTLHGRLLTGKLDEDTYRDVLDLIDLYAPIARSAYPVRRVGIITITSFLISVIPAFKAASYERYLLLFMGFLTLFIFHEFTMLITQYEGKQIEAIALIRKIEGEEERYFTAILSLHETLS